MTVRAKRSTGAGFSPGAKRFAAGAAIPAGTRSASRQMLRYEAVSIYSF
jgi:hypothetical protein